MELELGEIMDERDEALVEVKKLKAVITRVMLRQDETFKRLKHAEEMERKVRHDPPGARDARYWIAGFKHDAYQGLTNIATEVLYPRELTESESDCEAGQCTCAAGEGN